MGVGNGQAEDGMWARLGEQRMGGVGDREWRVDWGGALGVVQPVVLLLIPGFRQGTTALKRVGPWSSCRVDGGSEDGLRLRRLWGVVSGTVPTTARLHCTDCRAVEKPCGLVFGFPV